jgi:hypothetical protein
MVIRMSSGAENYRRCGLVAKQRAAHCTDPSLKEAFKDVARHWLALAERVEWLDRQHNGQQNSITSRSDRTLKKRPWAEYRPDYRWLADQCRRAARSGNGRTKNNRCRVALPTHDDGPWCVKTISCYRLASRRQGNGLCRSDATSNGENFDPETKPGPSKSLGASPT